MFIALVLLLSLIVCIPAGLVVHGSVALAVVLLWGAVPLVVVGWMIRPGDAAHATRFLRPLVAIAVIPLIWIGLQLLPLPFLANSIWENAAATLNEPLSGKITIDIGMTALALCRYLSVIGIAIAVACVAIDRRRAELMLLLLAGVAALTTVVFIVHSLIVSGAPVQVAAMNLRWGFEGIASLGLLLSAGVLFLALDQWQTSRRETAGSGLALFKGGGGLLGGAICVLALSAFSQPQVFLAALCGLTPVVLVAILNRLPTLHWEKWAIVGVMLVIVASVAAGHLVRGSGDLTIRAAAAPDPSQIVMAQQLINDNNWVGSGAGAYSALVEIYRNTKDPPIVSLAPTAAAAVAVELGKPALAVFALLGGAVTVLLFVRALQRGRDSVYSAIGAGGAVIGVTEAFCNASLFGITVSVMSAVVLGLAFGQSLGLPRAH